MAHFDSPPPNLNRLWADLIVEELVRNGVNFFCLAPGSRSTPLTTAVAAHPQARYVVHFDERGTAYMALGYARATGRPAVWITTSGTAVANGLPAVVEAATDGVPMVLLTADRPPELRQTGANQTIDQVKIFGEYVRWFFDLPTPTVAVDPRVVLTTVDQAVHRSLGQPRGPVHLNCMFREPLAPVPDGQDLRGYVSELKSWDGDDRPFTAYAGGVPAVDPATVQALWKDLGNVERGVLVAGRLDTWREAEAVRHLAERLNWPLLPDICSHLRLGQAGGRSVIGYFDQILGCEEFSSRHRPEVVLHLGGRFTSKRLLQYLDRSRPERYVVVNAHPTRLDPNHQVTVRLEGDIQSFCAASLEVLSTGPAVETVSSWMKAWREADRAVARYLCDTLPGPPGMTEPAVAYLVSRLIPEGHGLVLAGSMPVRDMDMFAALDGAAIRVAANRGASGIDGLVATAAGFSEGLNAPVTLVIGDLALLYDLNALALLRDRPVVVIVLNNDGGGIFHFLPIVEHSDVFEPLFGTPHGLSFEAAAAIFGLAYHRPTSATAFEDVYRQACTRTGGTIIEVPTDRRGNRVVHEDLLQGVSDAVKKNRVVSSA